MAKLTYQEYINQGICPRCHKRPLALGRSRCEYCLENGRQYSKQKSSQWRDRWLEQGICPDCRQRPIKEGKKRCEVCLKEIADRYQKKRQEAQKIGLCANCASRPVESGQRLCADCREAARKATRKWIEKHKDEPICLRCRKPLDDLNYSSCSTCREQQKERSKQKYHNRKKNKVCLGCGGKLDTKKSKRFCSRCLKLARERRTRGHSKQRYDGRLEAVIKRDRACVICGLPYGIKKNDRHQVVCHHIDGNVDNNSLSNLVLLCRECHGMIEAIKRKPGKQRAIAYDFMLKHYPPDND